MSAVATLQTRFGPLGVEEINNTITRLIWNPKPKGQLSPLLTEALSQLEAYDQNRLTVFDLPLAPNGSAFQQRVFAQMLKINFGNTKTYGEIAKTLSCPAQPVGQACGANPIPIIIPCHRVLAKNGIGGFSAAGGIECKIALLKHENGFPYLL